MRKTRLLVGGTLLLAGCSQDTQLRQELKQLRISVEEQQQRVETVEREAKKKAEENFALQAQLKATEKRVEQVARRPTFTVEEPTITFQRAAPSPPINAVDVILKSVSVLGTRSNGNAWDESGPPDLKVRFETSSDRYTTPTRQDSYSASFGSRVIRVAEGDSLTVTVIDGDVFADDTIGEYTKVITAETIRQGTVAWSFDRVDELVLRFEP